MKAALKTFLFLCLIALRLQSSAQTTIFANASTWKYLNDGVDQGTSWYATGFNDASWSSGTALLHVGESGGTNLGTLNQTTYFRKSFTITGLSAYSDLTINLVDDDGSVVYINGVEVMRNNMPTGTISYSTNASNSVNGGSEGNVTSSTIAASYFVEGNNVIAVEVHQASTNGSDMRFQMNLVGNPLAVPVLTRGPYMNMGTQSSVVIRWRTDIASDSRVEIGSASGTYTTTFDNPASTTEHEVQVTGLSTDTKYYYRFGSTTTILQGDANNFFRTAPALNTTRKMRFAVFGDCGRGSATNQDASLLAYRNYLTANSIDAPDAWLLMGDNAYNAGLDGEYTSNFFNIYQGNIAKNHIVFPTPGNHDYANTAARQVDHNIPYYSIFTLPSAGQCGGVSSGTEAYYSWNWGDIHFLALDSYGKENAGTTQLSDTAAGNAQMDWIRADLAANTQKWVIAYWHHPPYTMGSHNSDTETDLIAIRTKTIKVLERLGVDLILNGHSHVYERSYIINGNYGLENTFNIGTMAKSNSSAFFDGTSNSCPYTTTSGQANKGTVYVVAGSTGSSLGTQGSFPHAAFPWSLSDAGIFYFEVQENRLDAKFIRDDGSIWDKFTIMKDVAQSNTYNIVAGSSITLTASWPAAAASNYSWNTGSNGRNITVTPALGTNNYTVTDNFGCITDNITVNVFSVLPVSLAQFNVYQQKTKVNIDWVTASEENSKYFTVERSMNGRDFDFLAQVNAAGNSSTPKKYNAVDGSPFKGTSYYRLVQTDIDGKKKMSEVKKIVNTSGKGFDVKLATDGNIVNISLITAQQNKIMLRVYDMNGREVDARSWSLTGGTTQGQIRLQRGTYIFNFTNQLNETTVRKLIIE